MLDRRSPASAPADAALLARQDEIAALQMVAIDLAAYLRVADRRGTRDTYRHALDMAHDATARAICDLRAEIATMPARTLPGIRFKASIAELERLDHDDATRVLMLSIVADILAMDITAGA